MGRTLRSLAAMGLMAIPGAAETASAGEVWADDTSAVTVNACRKATAVTRPAADSGAAARRCDAAALYYGIGRAADYPAARACALNARNTTDTPIGGPALLAMIYANGDGVPRDDDLAIAYACDAGGAPAEIDGRVKHLLRRKAKGAAVTARYDVCDDITSGYMQGFCAARDSRISQVKREETLAGLIKPLKPDAAVAYAALRKAERAYVSVLAENEVDLSGTGRAAFEIETRDEAEAAFIDLLRQVLTGALPPGAPEDFAVADGTLNSAYRKALKAADDAALGTVTKDGIRKTERAWLAYRDGFLAFTAVATPKVSPDGLKIALSGQRTARLKFLSDEP